MEILDVENRIHFHSGNRTQAEQTILTEDALEFVDALHQKFEEIRKELLRKRQERQEILESGITPGYPIETQNIREASWQVGAIPKDLEQRRVEITGPVDRKMMINALNSGADVFMADLEDANSPTWKNVIEGQVNLMDAVRKNITFSAPNGKFYALKEQTATLLVRPRGWHLTEKNIRYGESDASASLVDFGLFIFHNAHFLIENGSGPYFYLPKLEHYEEARLWNDVFLFAEEFLEIPAGTIKATVLIETILAALQMEEIIYELKEHLAGLNAGRWDYIFSAIKKFHHLPGFSLPDRGAVTMQAPFMLAYTKHLVETCHKRGAHAIGGMSAFIPSKDEELNVKAFEKVEADKVHEANLGFDGSWVAHPGLVGIVKDVFNKKLGDELNQKDFKPEYSVAASELTNFLIPGTQITEVGIRTNIRVGILYLHAWLNGVGAAAIDNLMEDAATAEISRAQLWQWLRQEPAVKLADGKIFDFTLYESIKEEELEQIKSEIRNQDRLLDAVKLFDHLIKTNEFKEFLTLGAYQTL